MKAKEIQKMTKQEREKKLQDLKLELIKAKVNSVKSGGSKVKNIKKIIARIYTINASENKKGVLNKR